MVNVEGSVRLFAQKGKDLVVLVKVRQGPEAG